MTDSDLCAGDTQRVLVDGDEVPVQQQVPRLLPDVAQVVGHEEGGGQNCPHRHLHPLLVVAQPKVAHDDLIQ